MHVLKVLFQQRALQSLGTKHLMPLLRLVEGDLATQALDVLEEPTKITGGPTAKQVLRMSMHVSSLTGAGETEIFGVPEDSGWCISPARINVQMGDDRALQLLDDSAQEIQTLSPTRIWRRACARCRDRKGTAPRRHAIFGNR